MRTHTLLAGIAGIAFPGSAAHADRAYSLRYRIGSLFRVSQAAPIGEAIAELEYEVHCIGVRF